MDNLEFLDAGEPANGEAAPTPQAEVAVEQPVEQAPAEPPADETAEQKASRERDQRGRFKAKEADEPVMVPLKALHETRDEVKALKAQLEAATQPQQQQPAPEVPDIFSDPEGYTAYIQNQIAQTTLNDRLNLSEDMMRQSAGAEVVDAAQEWGKSYFAANPALFQQFLSQRNPYGFLVSEFQRQTALAQIGNDPDEIKAFLAWKEAQKAIPQPAAQAASPQPQRPTGSIATAVSAGGAQHQATGPGVAFDEHFRN